MENIGGVFNFGRSF